ncbi:hypothetical protein AAE478_001390 [Parahypoxylon ruwenzoriense]
MTSRIQARFRDCRFKKDPKPHVKDAHHFLRYLRSANAGHVSRMLHICFLATGRTGKRRRLLARSELASRPATSSAELDEKARLTTGSLDSLGSGSADRKYREPDWLDNWSVDKIKAVAFTQLDQQKNDWPHNMRRLVDPARVLPTENSFGRPLTNKLARNKLKKHWASVLRQLLPPLPQGEWDQLGVMARGEADPQHYKMPPRRPVAQSLSTELETAKFDWTSYVTKSVRSLERGTSRRMKSLSGREDDDPRGHGRPIGVRVLGERRLRRSIYSRVWETSPTLGTNPWSGKPTVTWGNCEVTLSRPRKKDLQFFQGIDKNGRPVQSASGAAAS